MTTVNKLRRVFVYLVLLTALFIAFRFIDFPAHLRKSRLVLASLLEKPLSLSSDLQIRIKGFFTLPGIVKENKQLKEKNEELRQKIITLEEFENENSRLRKLLSYRETLKYKNIVAKVIGRTRNDFFDGILLNKGISDGVKEGTPVLADGALIGRVIEANSSVSKVLLLTNPNVKISAILSESRELGLVQGNGTNLCIINYISKDAIVKEGDKILTSGMSQIYPKGLFIGEIKEIKFSEGNMFKYGIVHPGAKLSRLEEVICLISIE